MKPLNGIRIVSIEQFGAAPYGSMFLADLGAEVIKIENIAAGGDPARHLGPYFLGENDSQYFQTWNSNKRSVGLDLKSPQGRADLERLVAGADAVMNNLRGDKAAPAGLDYASLSRVKPSIVCLHMSAYGRDNSRASWPGYDYLMQAESGLMDLTGDPDRAPARMGAPSIIDHATGLTAMVGLLSAIIQARGTGIGCDVDTCLFDVALHQLGYSATWYLNEGHKATRQTRSSHFSVTPVQTFPTRDGWVFVMCMTDRFWQALVERLDDKTIGQDPRFADGEARTAHRTELTELLDADFRRHDTDYWMRTLGGVLPIAPVLDIGQALDNPFLREAAMVGTIEHPARAALRLLANPIKINGRRLEQSACAGPGADTAAVLGAAKPS